MKDLFPEEINIAQMDISEASLKCIHNKIPCESGVEERFLKIKIKPSEDQLVYYFKFPKVVQNYIPDWGFIRKSENGSTVQIQLVRETKGTINLEKLRFYSEERKIKCAKKYFEALNIDYRTTTDNTSDWLGPEDRSKELLFV